MGEKRQIQGLLFPLRICTISDLFYNYGKEYKAMRNGASFQKKIHTLSLFFLLTAKGKCNNVQCPQSNCQLSVVQCEAEVEMAWAALGY